MKIDLTPIREIVISLYEEGLSGSMIGEKVGLKSATIRAFLAREGLLRSMSDARKIAYKNGRVSTSRNFHRGCGHFPPKNKRDCEICHEQYTPNGARQRWCSTCVPDDVSRRRAQRYGISKSDWDSIVLKQGGTCALCSLVPTTVDHDHKTGKVRGALCGGCNSALGKAEIVGWFDRAKDYLCHS